MGLTISMVSSKGGVGKTTSAVVVAGELAQSGESVILIDADPNRPLEAWAQRPGRPESISVVIDESADTIVDTINDARERAKWVIVDLEGRAADRVGFAVAMSDFVAVPVQPSILDANEAAKSIKLIRQMSRMQEREIPFGVFFSRVSPAIQERTKKDIETQLRENKIPLLSPLYDRAAFRALFSLGGTIHSLDPRVVSGLDAAKANSHQFVQALVDQIRKKEAA